MTTASFVVSIFDDGVLEDNENFMLTINSESTSIPVVNPDQATVTIEDNDGNICITAI